MRCSTILAASAMAILSVVSAQDVPSAASMLACNTCVNNAGIAAVPACKGLENTQSSPGTPATDKQKACWCGLKSNKTWADSCVGPDKCSAQMKELLVQAVATQTSPSGFCDNVSATSAAAASNRFFGSSSAKVAAAGAAALAVAGALL